MKILSWNVGDPGNPQTLPALRHLVRSHKPQVFFLMETRCKNKLEDRIKRELNFGSSFCIPSIGNSGGLMLLWDSDTNLSIRFTSQGHID